MFKHWGKFSSLSQNQAKDSPVFEFVFIGLLKAMLKDKEATVYVVLDSANLTRIPYIKRCCLLLLKDILACLCIISNKEYLTLPTFYSWPLSSGVFKNQHGWYINKWDLLNSLLYKIKFWFRIALKHLFRNREDWSCYTCLISSGAFCYFIQ